MFAVLSATEDDFYAMPLPFACYSWRRIGFSPIVFIPNSPHPKLDLAKKYCFGDTLFFEFESEQRRIPTYSQVIRLFGSAIQLTWNFGNNVMITADSDMCVFSDFFKNLNDGKIHIVGNDLTPDDQYPMCFAAMPVMLWNEVMKIGIKSYQECVSELIDPIESDNIRGTQWSYDQWYLKKMLATYKDEIVFHQRSNGQNQYAQNRADRDGWHFDVDSIIDAHLPRPLTNESNFSKLTDLFAKKYPNDNFEWLVNFRNEYIKLL